MYRPEDLEKITSNLSRIRDEAAKIYLDKYEEPSAKEYNNVMNDIKKYIKEKELIIYGGYAQNALISKKSSSDEFYNELSRADLEIYSPNPIKDAMGLSDILFKKGYKYIVCEEGVHNETYKIFVNFLNFSDISYMDPHVFKNCPYILIDGLKMTHPHFMLVDAFRVYADPMTSYFRLEKTFTRFTTLMKHYPFDSKAEYNQISYKTNKDTDMILRFIRKHILHNSKLVVFGQYAFNYYAKKVDNKLLIKNNNIQVTTTEFKKDFDKILKILKSKFGSKISYQLYHPFFQFYDERVEFIYNGNVILKLYGNNNRCIVHNYSDKKRTYFSTFLLTMLYLLVDYNLAKINNDKIEESNILSLIVRLMSIRDKYLDARDLTVLDKSPFQEFTYECFGEPVDPIRSARLKMQEKKDSGKKIKFRYNPTGNPGKVPSFKFDNSSGKKK
tara:strand:+ start:2667 stop:3995 length:1329 start_codon:yes stop_codon:yes gene_type:complete